MRQEKSLKLKRRKYDPKKEYSGKIILRFSPHNHEQISRIAYERNMSINLLLNIMIEEGIKKERNREKRRNRILEEDDQ